MTKKESFGEHIRTLRKNQKLTLKKVAAALDIDLSTLRIDSEESPANKKNPPLLDSLFNESEAQLEFILLSERVANDLKQKENPNQILKTAEEKIKYLKKQGSSIRFA
jgi:transcriptional regulator with XRE-family HTH domain